MVEAVQYSRARRWALIIILMMIAFNLRMAFTAADPLLNLIDRELHLSHGWLGFFAVIPVLCLGFAAVFTPWLSSLIIPRKLLLYSLMMAFCGVLIRSFCGITGLYIGMFFIGFGLGIAGTVVVPIMKQVFPEIAGKLVSVYVAVMCLGSSFSSYMSDWVVSHLGSWELGLSSWDLPLSIALVSWWVYISQNTPTIRVKAGFESHLGALMKQPSAWYVTLFFMFRVAGAYLVAIWVSTLMLRRGMDTLDSSHVFAVVALIQIPSSLSTQISARLLGGVGHLIVVASFVSIVFLGCLLFLPIAYWIFYSVGLGWAIGILFSVGMQLIVDKSQNEQGALVLSSMTQGLAFFSGGFGAFIGSYIVDTPYAFEIVFGLYAVYAIGSAVFGFMADKSKPVILPRGS